MTVSRAINNKEGIREQIWRHLLQIAQAPGYRTGPRARSLVTQQMPFVRLSGAGARIGVSAVRRLDVV